MLIDAGESDPEFAEIVKPLKAFRLFRTASIRRPTGSPTISAGSHRPADR